MLKKIAKDSSVVLLVFLVFTLGLIVFTPYPTAGLVHALFSGGGPAKNPTDMSERLKRIKNDNDRSYSSMIQQNTYDFTRPDSNEKVPLIIWVHGGAFVGGDKSDNRGYAQMLASEGYAVANMNYDLAPHSRYPSPLIQISDLYEEVVARAESDNIDLPRVYFAGDSAGGQLVMQFVNSQVDASYGKEIGLPSVVDPETIKGALLFCAPFSLQDLNDLGDSKLITGVINKIGWAYTGDAHWQASQKAQGADLLTVVKQPMPPLFVTDGNTFSFEKQGKAFAKKMMEQGTVVKSVFYNSEEEELMHAYQFDLTLKAAQGTFAELVSFLNETDN